MAQLESLNKHACYYYIIVHAINGNQLCKSVVVTKGAELHNVEHLISYSYTLRLR